MVSRHLLTKLLLLLAISGCAGYDKFRQITEEVAMLSKVYKADYNQTWQAVLSISKRFSLAQQNQEAGYIKTRWEDNTQELNFSDSFGSSDAVKAARFKLVINVVKGYRGSREVTKVTIYKRQLIEQDFLQGWKEIPTDGIQEQTLLYRIGRFIEKDNMNREIDKAREKEQMQNF